MCDGNRKNESDIVGCKVHIHESTGAELLSEWVSRVEDSAHGIVRVIVRCQSDVISNTELSAALVKELDAYLCVYMM